MSKDLKKQLADLFSDTETGPQVELAKPTKKAAPARRRAPPKSKPQPKPSGDQVEPSSPALVQSLIDDLPVGYHEIDMRGRITRINRTNLAMLGYTAEEMLGHSVWEFVLDNKASKQAIQAKLAGQIPLQTAECIYLHKDGHRVPALIQDRPLLDRNGKSAGIRTTVEDITERKWTEEALKASEEKYRTILENIQEGYFEVDIAGNFTFFNDALSRVLGYRGDELKGMNYRAYMDEENARTVYRAFNTVYRTHRASSAVSYEIRTKDGAKRPVEVSASLITDSTGAPVGFRGVMRDITGRKMAEDTLARRVIQLQAVAEISTAASTILETQRLLETVAHLTQRRLGLYHCHIFMLGEDGDSLSVRACGWQAGDSHEGTHETRAISLRQEQSLVAQAGRTRKPVVVNNVHADPTWLPNPLLPDVQSEITVPVVAGERLIGVLNAHSDKPDYFSDEDVAIHTTLAAQVATAIENARLFEQARRHTQELALSSEIMRAVSQQIELPRVLEAVYEQLCQLVPVDAMLIGLYDAQRNLITYPLVYDEGQRYDERARPLTPTTHIGQVIQSGQPMLLNRTPDELAAVAAQSFSGVGNARKAAASLLYLPLKSGAQVVGALSVQSYQFNAYRQEHMDLLTGVTSQIVIAIQNARLFEDSQRRVAEMAILNDMGREFSTALSLDELYRVVHQQVGRKFDTTSFFIGTYESGQDHWQMAYRIENGQPAEPGPRDLKAGLGSYMIRTLKSLKVNSAQELADFFQSQNVQQLGLPGTKSWMGVPLIAVGQVVGVMAIQSYEQENLYSDQDLALFSTIGTQVAIALQNARLFEQAQIRAEELATLNEISRVFSTRLDVSQVMNEIYRGASRLMDTTNFFIAEYDATIDEVSFPFYAEGHNIRRLTGRRRGGKGMTEYVIHSRAPLLIEQDVEGWLKNIGVEMIGTESQSWLGVPMLVGEQVIGVVAVQSYTTPRVYNEHHRDLLSAIAAQAAVALQNARLFEEAHTRAEELAALNDLSRVLSSRLSLNQVLDEVYRGVSRLLDTTNFYIALYDPVRHEASFPINVSESVADQEITVLPADQGITGYIIRTREPVLIKNDVNGWLASQGMPHVGEPAQSWLGVPLMIGDQIIGVMAVQDYKTPNVYDERARDMLLAIGAQTAIAIQNARLFEETRARAEELAALNELSQKLTTHLDLNGIVEEVFRGATRLMDTANFAVALYDESRDEIRFVLDRAEGRHIKENWVISSKQGITGYAIRHRQPVLLKEGIAQWQAEKGIEAIGPLRGPQSWLGVPMLVGDRVLGILITQSYTTPRAFDERDQELLTSIANQAAIAIQNARLFEETQQRNTELSTLNEIISSASQTLELKAILDAVLRQTMQVIGFDGGLITIYNEARGKLERIVRLGLPGQIPDDPAEGLENSLCAVVFSAKETVVIEDFRQGAPVDVRGEIESGYFSYIGVPLEVRGRILGTLCGFRKKAGPFGENATVLLRTVSRQIGFAVENARLFEQTQHSLAEARSLYEASRQIETARDLPDMLTAIAEGFRVPGLDWAALLMYERDDAGELQAMQVQGNWQSNQAIAPMPMGTRFSKEMLASAGLLLSATPVFFDDTQNDERIDVSMAAVLQRRNMRAVAVLPLGTGKTQFGNLMLAGQDKHNFTEREMQGYATLAGQMAVVMQNRRLLQEAEARARREQILREITARVRGSTDPDTIVRTAVRELGTALGRPTFVRLGSAEQLAHARGNGDGQPQQGGE